MPKALVTGAAGFVGRNLVSALQRSGRDVTAMVHFEAGRQHFDESEVEIFVGDICNQSDYAAHAQGADEIYHLASVVAPRKKETAFEVNVEGTRLLAQAIASADSPGKLIYVSSQAAGGPSSGESAKKESDEANPVSIYGKSKLAAEEALSECAGRLPVSIARPAGVFGDWDQNLLALFKSVKMGINTIGISKRYRYSFIHVHDLTDGLIRICDSGTRLSSQVSQENDTSQPDAIQNLRTGTYFLADANAITFIELGNMIAETLEKRHPLAITIPLPVCATVAAFSQWYGNLFDKRVYLNLDKVREAKAGSWVCDVSRAEQETGFQSANPLPERLLQTKQWYDEHGLL